MWCPATEGKPWRGRLRGRRSIRDRDTELLRVIAVAITFIDMDAMGLDPGKPGVEHKLAALCPLARRRFAPRSPTCTAPAPGPIDALDLRGCAGDDKRGQREQIGTVHLQRRRARGGSRGSPIPSRPITSFGSARPAAPRPAAGANRQRGTVEW
jgi:hypothetical protein